MNVSERIYEMAAGHADTPAADGTPARRWSWFAALYDDPRWGLGATIPDFTAVGATVGKLCRATVAGDPDSLKVRWDILGRLAAIKGAACPVAEHHAWTAVTNSCIDAHDFLDDLGFGGVEVATSAFTAIVAGHADADAEKFIAQAVDAWAACRLAPEPSFGIEPLPHIDDFSRDRSPLASPAQHAHLPLGVAS
ncbi:hypothetical protein [Rhodococcus sp. 1139]|uniref:hypothetical protein n=1 Tax=Rhodococcus sp. 1139 TaxID=1833762 RepID=UPI0008725261|nr:hypothetical protein [Rhodococcus sp. 1139]OFE10059.1 hypothetical protein A5N83_04330 [Rhodococcus sp. 1139]